MTHQEKKRIYNEYSTVAKSWPTDFLRNQFKILWQVQRDIESNIYLDLMDKTIAIQPLQVKRSVICDILHERDEL